MNTVFPHQFMTADERHLFNLWARGSSSALVRKLQRIWVIECPTITSKVGGPVFKTKREAVEFVRTFITEVIPRRCRERAGVEDWS